jgi:hypothetical protein
MKLEINNMVRCPFSTPTHPPIAMGKKVTWRIL